MPRPHRSSKGGVRLVAAACVLGAVGVGLFVGGLAVASSSTATTMPSTPTSTTTTTTAAAAASTTTAPPVTAPPVTAAPTTTTTVDAAAASEDDGTLERGEDGPAVEALQARLVELGYWLGTPDGTYGDLTEQAVLAFQKAEGLGRDGRAGPATRTRLAGATRPVPQRITGDGIEVDLTRQLLLVVRGGAVLWALNTSTGTADTPTPAGDFEVEREIDGVRHAPLGRLYRPKYFHGGIAIHGYPSVPAHPASHGCARVSNAAMDLLWAADLAARGTPVSVYDG